ncbi:MAG: hypothetical protein WBM28_05850, partial [Burkholderiales bacterium]
MATHTRFGASMWLVRGGLLFGVVWTVAESAYAGPGACAPANPPNASEVTCTGDQSGGIKSGVDFQSPPVTTLNVDTAVRPATTGTPGIDFRNDAGAALIIRGGSPQQSIVITTSGDNAGAMLGESRGTPVGTQTLFGLAFPVGVGGSGGAVSIFNSSAITTDGSTAHGIAAQSRAGGYSDETIAFLQSMRSTNNAGFSIVSVSEQAGSVGQSVAGSNGGAFTLNANGSYSYSLTGDQFTNLAVGRSLLTSVSYRVSWSGTTDLDSDAVLTLKVTKRADGGFDVVPDVFFIAYGPSATAATTLRPDLVSYYDALLRDVAVGGVGSDVVVTSGGTIETRGQNSFGIYAQSKGGQGAAGGGGIFNGSAGVAGGAARTITVTNHSGIVTHGAGSHGIVARSIGGDGGRGGGSGIAGKGGNGGAGGASGLVSIFN